MPTPPYWYVRTTPFGLSGSLPVPFTRVNAGAVVMRKVKRKGVQTNGKWTWVDTDVDGPVEFLGIDADGIYRYRQQFKHTDWTYQRPVLREYDYSYAVWIDGPEDMLPGDELVYAFSEYEAGRAHRSGDAVSPLSTSDLPALPQTPRKLAYTDSYLSWTVRNTVASNDFGFTMNGDPYPQLCPMVAEVKGERAVGEDEDSVSRTLWCSRRFGSVSNDAWDVTDKSAIRFIARTPNYTETSKFPWDEAMRAFDPVASSLIQQHPLDGDAAAYLAATPVSNAAKTATPNLTIPAPENDWSTGRWRACQATNKGRAAWGKGSTYGYYTGQRLTVASQEVKAWDMPDGSPTTWANDLYYYWGSDADGNRVDPPPYSQNFPVSIPSYSTQPEHDYLTVHVNPALDGGTVGRYTFAVFDDLWHVDLPLEAAAGDQPPPSDERAREAFTATYPASWADPEAAAFAKSVSVDTEAVLWQFFLVEDVTGTDPGGGDDPEKPFRVFGLTMDWNVFYLTRILHNTPPGTAVLTLKLSDDREATWTSRDLGFNGTGPSLLCTDDGAMLLATSGVTLRRSLYEGHDWTTMSTPGSGYYPCLFEARGDVFSPLFCVASEKEKDAGTLLLYRSWDRGATWEAPITVTGDGVAISAPAQRVSLTGSMSELLLAYHSGGTVHVLRSTDCGATWEEV